MEGDLRKSRRANMKARDFVSAAIYSPLIVGQFILTVFFYQNYYNLDTIMYMGWIVWIMSIFFAFAPMVIFKRRGGVPEGKSYMHTTKLVTTGLYGVVRHPQYTGGLLLILAMMMVAQHPLVVLMGCIALFVFYIDIAKEDRDLCKIFGKPYKKYMRRVPRTNFVAGAIWAARRKRKRRKK